MAVRSIATTDTLETFRTEFNNLAALDFGDIATLDSTLSASTVIGAVNELSAQVSANLGIFIEDASSSRQQVGAGQTLNFRGTSNQVDLTVSATDTLTASLPNDVTIPNNLTVTSQASAVTGVFGSTLTIGSGSIVDSGGTINFGDDNLTTTGNVSGATINGSSIVSTGAISGTTITGTGAVSGTQLNINETIVFEGSSADDFETSLTVTNPTADRTITIPDVTGTLVTTGDTGSVTSAMILNGTIANEDISDATIRASKLNLGSDTLTVDTLNANTITGAASVASLVSLTSNDATNETVFITFADGATGNQGLETDADLTYNPSTNVLSTTASQANYADLAEYYTADQEYVPGTVVMFGGNKEVTIAEAATTRVAGVISTNPAYAMNANLIKSNEISVALALQGRVPCKVVGEIKKGDLLISAGNGVAMASQNPQIGQAIGKALEDYNSHEEGIIEVVVGRL